MSDFTREEFLKLVQKYNAGQATLKEIATLESYYELFNDLPEAQLDGKTEERLLKNIHSRIHQNSRKWRWIAAAATILIAFGIGTLIFRPHAPVTQQNAELRQPAKAGVTLRLANGQSIALLAQHNAVRVTGSLTARQHGDSLAYQPAASSEINTLSNNSGHRYTLTLSDGTEVSLDVASSITYPVAFNGAKRQVSMTGQAFFKVHHDAAHPFSVSAAGTTIEDIGTAFNVNTFEQTQTTLIEGAVKVNNHLLKPGEMTNGITVTTANVGEVTAWLQDKISYKNATLEHIMTEVARVYQIKLDWQDETLKQRSFIVKLSRNTPLANILNYFRETSDIDFKVTDKTVSIFKRKPPTN